MQSFESSIIGMITPKIEFNLIFVIQAFFLENSWRRGKRQTVDYGLCLRQSCPKFWAESRILAYPRIQGTDSIINLARILVVQSQLIQNPARRLVGQNDMINQPSCSCPGDKPTDLFQNRIFWRGSCTIISNIVSVYEY